MHRFKLHELYAKPDEHKKLSFRRNSKEPTLMSSNSAQVNLQRDQKNNKILGANILVCKNHRTRWPPIDCRITQFSYLICKYCSRLQTVCNDIYQIVL